MNDNKQKISFIPFLDFNNPIFIDLDKQVRPLLSKAPSNLSRELQIRTLLYTNFNNYLTLLLATSDSEKAMKMIKDIDDISETGRLKLISSIINQPIEIITTNFIELFNRVD